jgi:hypothetical protein
MHVAKAYFMLFGRIPDIGGLNYWVSRVAANNGSTFIETVNIISREARGTLISPIVSYIDSTGNIINSTNSSCSTSVVGPWDELIEYVYANALGRAAEDEDLSTPSQGMRYWQCEARRTTNIVHLTPGHLLNTLSNAASTDEIYSNRLLFLESALRLQIGRNRDLNYHDSYTLLQRVRGSTNSFNDAFNLLNQLTNGNVIAQGVRWEIPSSGAYNRVNILNNSSQLPYSEKSISDGATIYGGKVHKYLIWYNRSGRMMLAHAFLPQNYQTSNVYYPTIVSVFGGGWRGGLIEKNQRFNTSFV